MPSVSQVRPASMPASQINVPESLAGSRAEWSFVGHDSLMPTCFDRLDARVVIVLRMCSLGSRICSRPKRHRSSSARESATCRNVGWTSATQEHAAVAQTEGRICQSSIISSNHVRILVEHAGRVRRERMMLPRSSNLDPDEAVSFRCSAHDFRQGCRRRSVLSPRDETKTV